jgi:hypothetical protein
MDKLTLILIAAGLIAALIYGAVWLAFRRGGKSGGRG